MAKYNEILVGRFARGCQKLFGMKGDAAVSQVAGEVMPVVLIPRGVEDVQLFGWERFGLGVSVATTPLQRCTVMLRNPDSSNMICVVEKLTAGAFAGPVAPEITIVKQLTLGQADLALPSGSIPLDGRGRGNATLFVSQGATASTFIGQLEDSPAHFANANTLFWNFIWTENQEITILPGWRVIVQYVVQNTQIIVNMIWRERFLEQSEAS
jgi:hypothetical protein